MPEPVRLVIWDLDETFWIGTLSEEGVTQHIDAHYAIVKTLAARGIMSSICSKNDYETVRQLLLGKGIWDTFIFPSIDWLPKGPRLRYIIEAVQLRPESVLFIDDNPSNLGEAQALVPGLQVSDETIIPLILDNPLFAGKSDPALERLAQYKLLEKRSHERGLHAPDVSAFLKSSQISIEIAYDIEHHLARIVELVNRTNQLNFTKRRLPAEQKEAEIELQRQVDVEFGVRTGVVKVRDKFGDYGVVGFFLMHGVWGRPYLMHFVFSCRTLGMGVEQWVYEKLGRPQLQISGDVVSRLDFVPDWINVEKSTSDTRATAPVIPRVRMRGGCELEVLAHFFSFVSPAVETEFVFHRDLQTVWNSHTQTLLHQPALQSPDGLRALESIGLDARDADTTFLADAPPGTLLVLSNTADFEVSLFRHRELGFRVPVRLFGLEMTRPVTDLEMQAYLTQERLAAAEGERLLGVNRMLHAHYDVVTPDNSDFRAMYKQVMDRVPQEAVLVVLLPLTYAKRPGELVVHYDRQSQLTAIMREEAAGRSNVRLVTIAELVTSLDDLISYSHLHLTRKTMHRVFEAIVKVYQAWRETSLLLEQGIEPHWKGDSRRDAGVSHAALR